MSDWREDAACHGQAPLFDLKGHRSSATTPQLVYLATTYCDPCPVSQACETYHDRELVGGEPLSCVAAGFLYRAGSPEPKVTIVHRRCSNPSCGANLYHKTRRYCSSECAQEHRRNR